MSAHRMKARMRRDISKLLIETLQPTSLKREKRMLHSQAPPKKEKSDRRPDRVKNCSSSSKAQRVELIFFNRECRARADHCNPNRSLSPTADAQGGAAAAFDRVPALPAVRRDRAGAARDPG